MLSNPLNALLVPPILYLVYLIIRPAAAKSPATLPDKYSPDEYNWLPAKHPDVVCFQKFSPAELARHDGKDGGRICLAIYRVDRSGKIGQGGKGERTVFDVTAGRNFYGPGEWPQCRAGLCEGCSDLKMGPDACICLLFRLLQTACTETLPGEMRLEAWRSSRLTMVGVTRVGHYCRLTCRHAHIT